MIVQRRAAPKIPSFNATSIAIPTIPAERRSTLNLLYNGRLAINNADTSTIYEQQSEKYAKVDDGTEGEGGTKTASVELLIPETVVSQVVNSEFKCTNADKADKISLSDVRKDRRSTLAMLLNSNDNNTPVEDRIAIVIDRPFVGYHKPPESVIHDRRSTLAMLFGDGGLL